MYFHCAHDPGLLLFTRGEPQDARLSAPMHAVLAMSVAAALLALACFAGAA